MSQMEPINPESAQMEEENTRTIVERREREKMFEGQPTTHFRLVFEFRAPTARAVATMNVLKMLWQRFRADIFFVERAEHVHCYASNLANLDLYRSSHRQHMELILSRFLEAADVQQTYEALAKIEIPKCPCPTCSTFRELKMYHAEKRA